jgi:HD-like signal output (HDOD) protein
MDPLMAAILRGENPELDEHNQRQQALAMVLRVKQALDSGKFKPPLLPEVALSLTQMAQRPDVDLGQVENTVSQDPTVAARVVATANSALFSRGSPARSLRMAIMRLGLAEVRNVAYEVVAQTSVFRVRGYDQQMRVRFEQGQAAGALARQICRLTQAESEMAYLCGLLHDMGEAIILGILGQEATARRESSPPLETVQPMVDEYHARVGAHVCRMWQLPSFISDAVLHHHHPLESTDPSQMATVIAVANRLVSHAGIGMEADPVDPMQEPLFYRLNLTPNQVTELTDFADSLAQA